MGSESLRWNYWNFSFCFFSPSVICVVGGSPGCRLSVYRYSLFIFLTAALAWQMNVLTISHWKSDYNENSTYQYFIVQMTGKLEVQWTFPVSGP